MKIKVYNCKRCKYFWVGRKPNKPIQCPRCKSYSWEKILKKTERRTK